MLKKILVILNAGGIVICIWQLFTIQNQEIFKLLAMFLGSMAYTIWEEQLLRLGMSLKYKDSYDIEFTKFHYMTNRVVTVILTVGGYICCAGYALGLM